MENSTNAAVANDLLFFPTNVVIPSSTTTTTTGKRMRFNDDEILLQQQSNVDERLSNLEQQVSNLQANLDNFVQEAAKKKVATPRRKGTFADLDAKLSTILDILAKVVCERNDNENNNE